MRHTGALTRRGSAARPVANVLSSCRSCSEVRYGEMEHARVTSHVTKKRMTLWCVPWDWERCAWWTLSTTKVPAGVVKRETKLQVADTSGWLHFYPGHLALQKVHFRAMRTDVARGALSTPQGSSPHLTEQSRHAAGGTACRDCLARSGRAIHVVEGSPRLALFTWRRHRMLSE